LDTAGQEEYSAMRDQYIRTGDGFLIVYDVTKKSSLDDVKEFLLAISRAKDENAFPLVIAGNKIDLDNEREVSKEEGETFSKTVGAQFYETSAKDDVNVELCYYDLVRQIRKMNTVEEHSPRRKKLKLKCSLF